MSLRRLLSWLSSSSNLLEGMGTEAAPLNSERRQQCASGVALSMPGDLFAHPEVKERTAPSPPTHFSDACPWKAGLCPEQKLGHVNEINIHRQKSAVCSNTHTFMRAHYEEASHACRGEIGPRMGDNRFFGENTYY
jgi:hypothetical protein